MIQIKDCYPNGKQCVQMIWMLIGSNALGECVMDLNKRNSNPNKPVCGYPHTNIQINRHPNKDNQTVTGWTDTDKKLDPNKEKAMVQMKPDPNNWNPNKTVIQTTVVVFTAMSGAS